MEVELVIARYNENLNWITNVPNNIKITIYNKGKDDLHFKSIKIPNVGRESNTYLYHIIKNYKKLSNKTIFTQGNPFDHCPNFLKLLKFYDKYEKIQPLNSTIDINEKLRNLSYIKINDIKIHIDYVNNDFIPCYPTYWYNMNFENYVENIKNIYSINNLFKYYKKKLKLTMFNSKYLIPVNYAAIFSVNSEIISKNSLKFYKNMNKILLETKKFDLGYIYERLWMIVFYFHKYNSHYKKLKVSEHKLQDKTIYPKDNIHLKVPILYNWLISVFLTNNDKYEFGLYKSHLKYKSKNIKDRIKFKNKINKIFIFKIKKLKNYYKLIIHEFVINLPKNVKVEKIIFHNCLIYI